MYRFSCNDMLLIICIYCSNVLAVEIETVGVLLTL